MAEEPRPRPVLALVELVDPRDLPELAPPPPSGAGYRDGGLDTRADRRMGSDGGEAGPDAFVDTDPTSDAVSSVDAESGPSSTSLLAPSGITGSIPMSCGAGLSGYALNRRKTSPCLMMMYSPSSSHSDFGLYRCRYGKFIRDPSGLRSEYPRGGPVSRTGTPHRVTVRPEYHNHAVSPTANPASAHR